MKIIDALKDKEGFYGMRVSYGRNWLVFDDHLNVWEVWTHKYGAKKTTRLYSGDDEDMAVMYLTADDL
jgi:hypothetical protein